MLSPVGPFQFNQSFQIILQDSLPLTVEHREVLLAHINELVMW